MCIWYELEQLSQIIFLQLSVDECNTVIQQHLEPNWFHPLAMLCVKKVVGFFQFYSAYLVKVVQIALGFYIVLY